MTLNNNIMKQRESIQFEIIQNENCYYYYYYYYQQFPDGYSSQPVSQQ